MTNTLLRPRLMRILSAVFIIFVLMVMTGTASAKLYLTSLDIGDATFAEYDPETDTWTAMTPYETGAQMAVSSTGQLYAHGYNTSTIDRYNPSTDTWTTVMTGPPGASGRYGNLEVTNGGEFLYSEGDSTTLWYTSGGTWNTLTLPFTTNATGDYDPTTDQYVIGQRSTTNAHLIDVHTFTITDFSSSVGNGEWARFGVVMGNRYYFEADGSNIHSFDLGSPVLPPSDLGVSPGWYTGAAGDRDNSFIYCASLNGSSLSRFDTTTNTITPLAGNAFSAYHSSLAFVPGLTLTKTVGTEPGVCAATSEITVAPGTTVYYCYTITNNTDETFALHDLVDDQVGTIFSGFNYNLTPGSSINTVSAGLTVSAVINATTTNTATWTAYSVGQTSMTARAQATVTVSETPVAIPTLSEWGLMVMSLILAGTAVFMIRRPRTF